jgi:multidrug efflux system membrane fusion protein
MLFTLPEDNLPSVMQEMQAGPLPVEAWSRDGATKLGTGQLAVVDNQINSATATMRLKAVFQNPQHLLWPNQFIKARLHLTTRKNALVVPSTVVQRGPDGTFAYVIGQDQTVQPRPVEVDLTQGDVSVIAKGLSPGELVVVDGQNQLRPGSKVAPRLPGPGGPPAPKAPEVGQRTRAMGGMK